MKIKAVKFTALMLLLVLILGTAVGCSSRGKALLTLNGNSITINEYQLMLSLQKGEMAYAIRYNYGDYNSEDFWGTVVSSDGTTYNDYYNRAILEKAANYLSALALFDELGLKLPASYEEQVDEAMAEFIEYDGEGSKSALNRILAAYGMNYDKLRAYKLMTAKVDYLEQHLYGTDGAKIGKAVKDEYYHENYVAFKQILIANYYYVYETDANGDVIYYDTGNAKDVLYDKVNGKPVTGEDGKTVYYHEDGSIAYDKVNGKPSPVFNEDGTEKTQKYSAEELKELSAKASETAAALTSGDFDAFEELRQKHSDDVSEELYYLCKNVNYRGAGEDYAYMDDIAKALSALEVGESTLIETDYGYHIVMKHELEEEAYAAEESSQWFEDTNYYIYDFLINLKNELLLKRLEPYKDKVTVDTALWETIDIKDVEPNYYYY